MKMVRKQIYITQEQDERLKRLAEEQGLSEAEVVRAALDALAPLTHERAQASTGRVAEAAVMERYVVEEATERTGLALDRRLADAAWENELAFLRSLGSEKAGKSQGEAWKFNREELYEERLAKILRRH